MTTSLAPEALHPSLWRASELARATTRCVDTGHTGLAAQLPGGGWPVGTLIDLLVPQHCIGEMRLLGPALSSAASPGGRPGGAAAPSPNPGSGSAQGAGVASDLDS